MFTASVVASGTGTVTASIFPPLRTSLSVNDVVEIAAPKIEGLVLPGEELSWQLSLDHTTGISRSEEHTSELQSLMRISYAVFCLKKKTDKTYRQKHKIH